MAEDDNEIRRGDFARKKGEVVLREHEYDGIQEFDQKLPNWWLFTLYGAIVWSVVHWGIYYYTDRIPNDQTRVAAAVGALDARKQAQLSETLATLDDATLIGQWATDPAVVAAGEQIYTVNCVACHAADLSATMQAGGQSVPLPGLALNDGEWKYGRSPMRTFQLINEGTPPDSTGHNGARMQPWGQMLSPQQVAEVTAFLIARNAEEFENFVPDEKS